MSDSRREWTISTLLAWTGQYFRDKGVDNPRLDAEVLLSHVLGKDRLYLYVNFDQPLTDGELATYRSLVKERARRLPVAYIIGRKEFMGLSFIVAPAVLIPRPDTEILVEAALARLQDSEATDVLDLGTGSGAIIISILTRCLQARGVAVDIAADALVVAAANAERHGLIDRLELCRGDLFGPVADKRFAAIVSNPPYIAEGDLANLQPEVRFEPRLALAGGTDGLELYRRIIRQAPGYVKPGGFVALEAGAGQAAHIAALADEGRFFALEDIISDYGGIQRVVVLRAPG